MSFVRKFQKGDRVFHRPTGETWYLVEDEKAGWVTPGGWPASQGRAEDCKLVEGADEDEHREAQMSDNFP